VGVGEIPTAIEGVYLNLFSKGTRNRPQQYKNGEEEPLSENAEGYFQQAKYVATRDMAGTVWGRWQTHKAFSSIPAERYHKQCIASMSKDNWIELWRLRRALHTP